MKGNIETLLGGAFLAGSVPVADVEIDGATRSLREVFEEGYNFELHSSMSAARPQFKPLSGRFDPFDVERLFDTMGTWSTLTRSSILTFADTLTHALELCALWRQEDEELEVLQHRSDQETMRKEYESQTKVLTPGTREYELEEARIAWKTAVRERNEALRKWDEYVATKRTTYRLLRGK